MSYKLTDGSLKPSTDGYVRLFKDGYSAFLTHDGYNIALFSSSGTSFDGAKGIAFVSNRITAPDGYQPTGGGWLYAEGGDGCWSSSSGVVQSINSTLANISIHDGYYTAIPANYKSKIIQFSSLFPLTATVGVIVPSTAGYQWTIYNGTNGAQSIRIIVSNVDPNGVTIANGKRAIVYADGTNIVRVTPDT